MKRPPPPIKHPPTTSSTGPPPTDSIPARRQAVSTAEAVVHSRTVIHPCRPPPICRRPVLDCSPLRRNHLHPIPSPDPSPATVVDQEDQAVIVNSLSHCPASVRVPPAVVVVVRAWAVVNGDPSRPAIHPCPNRTTRTLSPKLRLNTATDHRRRRAMVAAADRPTVTAVDDHRVNHPRPPWLHRPTVPSGLASNHRRRHRVEAAIQMVVAPATTSREAARAVVTSTAPATAATAPSIKCNRPPRAITRATSNEYRR